METAWRIELFGGPCLQQNGRHVTRFQTYKSGALLAYLAYFRDQAHSREMLAGRFWPDSRPEAGRLSLRVALSSLRRQLETPGSPPNSVLFADHSQVQLNPLSFVTDIAEFNTALREAHYDAERRVELLTRAVELVRGELLPGYYEEWIAGERERLNDAYLGALRRLCQLLPSMGSSDAAIDYAHRAVIAAPFHEETHVALMKLYAATGRLGDALRQYDHLEQVLRDELNEIPAESTRAFAETIISQSIAPGRERTSRSPRARTEAGHQSLPIAPSIDSKLPVQFTRFFGRERELTRLRDLLSLSDGVPVRPLITLTGPAGSGKTRLAIEVVRTMISEFAGRTCFVPLAALSDPLLIPDAIAEALCLGRSAVADPLEQAVHALSGERVILILDNLEHLLSENLRDSTSQSDEGRVIVQTLMRRIPMLTCLITSRQPLEIEGELQFPVAPLQVPASVDTMAMEYGAIETPRAQSTPHPQVLARLRDIPSVQMFIDRAQNVRPDFQVTARNAASVAELCMRLEGLPLAIELAAAWAQTFTPAQMLAQLSSGSLLISRRKDRPERQLSVRSAIDWSFRMLTAELRLFFTRLSVFAGGCTLEAALDICGAGAVALSELSARSMILTVESGDVIRYRLLESLRQFAAEHIEDGERLTVASLHAQYYLHLAEEAETGLTGEDQNEWRDRLIADQDNLRAALDWGQSQEIGLRLAGALRPFWERSGEAAEGRRRITVALAGGGGAAPAARAKALYAAASLAALQGDLRDARASAEESLASYQMLHDTSGAAEAGTLLSQICHNLGDHEHAQTQLAQSLTLCRRSGSRRILAAALVEQGHRHGYYGDNDAADRCLEEAQALCEELGDFRGVALAAYHHAVIQQYRQDYKASQQFYEQALKLYRRIGDRVGMSDATFGIGYVARLRLDYVLASRTLEEFVSLQRQLQLRTGIVMGLRNLGCIARDQGDFSRANTLLQEALDISRATGYTQGVAEVLGSMGVVAQYMGNQRSALALHEECLLFRRESGNKKDIAESLNFLGLIAFVENDLAGARALLEEGLALARTAGAPLNAARDLTGLSLVALRQSRIGEAERFCLESLALSGSLKAEHEMIDAVAQCAAVRHTQGSFESAACLLGASITHRTRIGQLWFPFQVSMMNDLRTRVKAALGTHLFDLAWTKGTSLTLKQAVDYALDLPPA